MHCGRSIMWRPLPRVLYDRVDIGSYKVVIGDYDCDEAIDLTDSCEWERCMLGPLPHPGDPPYATGCEAFDFNAADCIDLSDFAGWQTVLPFLVILDAGGRPLADSAAPEGNVGFPVEPNEVAHFMSVVRTHGKDLTSERLALLKTELTNKPKPTE